MLSLLRNSLHELSSNPVLFAPKIASTLIGALWMLWTLEATKNLNPAPLLFFPVIAVLGIATPVVIAEMVKKQTGLKKAVRNTVGNWKKLLGATATVFLISLATVLPFYTGFAALIFIGGTTGLTAFAAGLAASVILLLASSYGIYYLPVALTSNTTLQSFKASLRVSRKKSWETTGLVVFSLLLFAVAAVSSGALKALGAAGFVAGRLVSGVVTTYVLTVSPKAFEEFQA